MPPSPNSLALFSHVPVSGNDRATSVVAHVENARHVSTIPGVGNALDIGFQIHGTISSTTSTTLATLGRGFSNDIYRAGSSISRFQCCFKFDLITGVVMLHDMSPEGTTQVYGDETTDSLPFEYGRVRKVVVGPNFNNIIGMGGVKRNLVLFQLVWHRNAQQIVELIKTCDTLQYDRLESTQESRRQSAHNAVKHEVEALSSLNHVSKHSSNSFQPDTNILASPTSLSTSTHKAR